MAWAAGPSKALLLLIYCLMYFPLFVGVLCLSLFWYALLCVLSNFTIILKRKRELVALLLLSYGCLVTVNVLWLFLKVSWVGLQCVVVVFHDHTHLLFANSKIEIWASSRENLSSGFPTKRDSNQSPQLQRLARKKKFHL